MKISNLSFAVIMALGVVACGGSGGGTTEQTVPENNSSTPAPAPAPAPEQPSAHDSTLVDPTQTHVVDDRDLLKETTVGSLQYIRRDGSDYDRNYNPEKRASSTPLLGVSLDVQNPKLTNIVLARQELTREDGKPVKAQFAGGLSPEPLTREGKPQSAKSLQVENYQNVDILAGAFKQFGSASNHTDGTAIPSNSLGDKFDYDTHVADNVRADREFNRERVGMVYTLRYEYKQPYVDYPNATDPGNQSYKDKNDNSIPFIAPSKPSWSIAQMQAALINDQAWATKDGNNATRHPVNTGTGDATGASVPFGVIQNTPSRFIEGGRTHPTGAYDSVQRPLSAWQAHPNDVTVNWTAAGLNNRYKQQWPNGAYPDYIAAWPQYPNAPYNHLWRDNNNTALPPNASRFSNQHHEHSYLEADEFTAIRQTKGPRPLVNPIANTWTWTLVQNWTYQELVQTGTNNGTPILEWQDRTANAYNPAGVGGTTAGSTRNWRLASADWIDPTNQYDGRQGEFRGHQYTGYNEEFRVIRYADRRIWDSTYTGNADPRDNYKPEYERKYGANLIWWSTQDSAFDNFATNKGWDPRARRVDNNVDDSGPIATEDLVRVNPWDRDVEIQPTGDITNGLVRIGGGLPTRGEELRWDNTLKTWQDHHNTTTRVFGRYHLAYSDGGEIKPVTLNSYQGVRSFVAAVQAVPGANGADLVRGSAVPGETRYPLKADLDQPAAHYSIGAVPMTLQKVQYGRVTTNLDIDIGEGPYEDGFLMSPFRYKNDNAAVDNYFYRGIEATTIDQMKAVTANNGAARYEGHALMYGIDNSFKGITKITDSSAATNLPNAFAIDSPEAVAADTARLGLGNFVQADVNFGTNKVTGDVYNAWLEKTAVSAGSTGAITKDLLVHFKGDIMGNTVIGTADRTYVSGDDKADFRASFFGEQADEMGGSFNSVTREQKYGSAYESGDWGGVFGAKKVGSGNTFQGDDGANVYTGTN